MRYKNHDFIGLHLKEDKQIIEYLVRALGSHITITEQDEYLVHKALRLMLDNKELKDV